MRALNWRRRDTVTTEEDLERVCSAVEQLAPARGMGYRSMQIALNQQDGATLSVPQYVDNHMRIVFQL